MKEGVERGWGWVLVRGVGEGGAEGGVGRTFWEMGWKEEDESGWYTG